MYASVVHIIFDTGAHVKTTWLNAKACTGLNESSQSPLVAVCTRRKSNKLQKVCVEHRFNLVPPVFEV